MCFRAAMEETSIVSLEKLSWSAWRELVVQAFVACAFNVIEPMSSDSDKVHVTLMIFHRLVRAGETLKTVYTELFGDNVAQHCPPFLNHFRQVLLTVGAYFHFLICKNDPSECSFHVQLMRFFTQKNKNFFEPQQQTRSFNVGLKDALGPDDLYAVLSQSMTTALSMAKVLHFIESVHADLSGF